jgi:CubicO group peptidase (beta-lactamase class C family)
MLKIDGSGSKTSLFLVFAISLFLTLCHLLETATAQTKHLHQTTALTQKGYSDSITQARKYVRELMKKQSLPGFSAAVAIDSKLVWMEGFGEADLENHVPVSTSTRFRLGSVSKLLTAAAVARLYEDGRLDLDAPVQRYVPYFPQKQYPITSRQLAGHIAGIRHYRDSDPLYSGKYYKTVREGLDIFQNDPLLFEPGTKYEYSSYGYNLLSAVVEGASGQDFLGYMHDHVFALLQMVHTVPDRNDLIIEGRTRFYYFGEKDSQFHNAPYVDNSYKWASGGFLSTAEDLARFGSAHLKPGFFKKETLGLLLTPQRLKSGEEAGTKSFSVGFGWRIAKDAKGKRVFHHGGAIEGGRAFLFVDEENRVVVALLANNFGGFAETEAKEIESMFIKR